MRDLIYREREDYAKNYVKVVKTDDTLESPEWYIGEGEILEIDGVRLYNKPGDGAYVTSDGKTTFLKVVGNNMYGGTRIMVSSTPDHKGGWMMDFFESHVFSMYEDMTYEPDHNAHFNEMIEIVG